MKEYKEIYAVDFDGTLCRGSRFPTIGNPNYYIDDKNMTVNDLTVRSAGLDNTIWQRSLEMMCKEYE